MTLMNRRHWLQQASATSLPLLLSGNSFTAETKSREKLPVAAIVTEYTPNSHADVLVGKILEGFQQQGGPGPDLKLAALYTDQVPQRDMSRALSRKYGFPITNTIEEAITLGTKQVQVAGVLIVGEHGDYPYTPNTKQHMYPRKQFFDAITATFKKFGKSVPVYNDKHLGYRWQDAKAMVDTSRKMDFPLMAGSSLPVAWRHPTLTLPENCEIESVLTIGRGNFEAHGFHALEAQQCLIEHRRGSTGVIAVETAQGKQIWEAEQAGKWNREMLKAALAVIPNVAKGKWEEILKDDSAFYFLEHQDGLKSTVAMVNRLGRHYAVAVKLKGQNQPRATWIKLELDPPFGHFAYLLKAIEHMIHTGQPAYPVERTLLTTGILDTVMHSLAAGGKRIETPQLAIDYEAVRWPYANQKT
ncbi:hypothetical protein V6x_14370 [Gimesia chilikensis]|uniref:Gfo/Idh/MocA family oxidoreductase n=1 Tax=Gimesia chilikensis TaxID=2605989 RepID=A0A517W920_9PLAN|nr:hypothetical protein [Gimesia chilikensis]QDU01754.1 hypothetical protein V6x_14370 [Gimesia chilikensis]